MSNIPGSGGGSGTSELMGALRFFLPTAIIGSGLYYLGRHLERNALRSELERERDLAHARSEFKSESAALMAAAPLFAPSPAPAAAAAAVALATAAAVDAIDASADREEQQQQQQQQQQRRQQSRQQQQQKPRQSRKPHSAAAAAGAGAAPANADHKSEEVKSNSAVGSISQNNKPAALRRVICAETMAWLNVQSYPLDSRCAHTAPDGPTPLAADGKKKSATEPPAPAPVPLVPWDLPRDPITGEWPDAAIITSIPDVCETGMSLPVWKKWFVEVSALMMRKVSPRSVCIFYQTDIKRDGVWIDKGHLIQTAADSITDHGGMHLLWHKIVICNQINTIKGKVSSYSHMLCFSRARRSDGRILSLPPPPRVAAGAADSVATAAASVDVKSLDSKSSSADSAAAASSTNRSSKSKASAADSAAPANDQKSSDSSVGTTASVAAPGATAASAPVKKTKSGAPAKPVARVQATPDLIAARGRMTWVRAMGLHACYQAVKYIAHDCPDLKIIIDPFCGRGSVLAVANDFGLHAIGVDWSPKRCRFAEELKTSNADYEALSEVEIKQKHPKQSKNGAKHSATAATAAAAPDDAGAEDDDAGDEKE